MKLLIFVFFVSMKLGMLYLIPSSLSDADTATVIPAGVTEKIKSLQYFISENEKTTRRFLKSLHADINQQEITIAEIDKHSEMNTATLLKPLLDGHDCGLLSEAGCPAVADPGSELVAAAHSKCIRVVPLTGPSSIILALMASGLGGQRFCFHGYLPIEKNDRIKVIKQLEKESQQKKQTQVFIETPYRNTKLLDDLVNTCSGDTLLCLACNITAADEFILTQSITDWKTRKPSIDKKPTVYLLLRK